jgi:ABC-type spermidine/putrescine transport system permease subunit I
VLPMLGDYFTNQLLSGSPHTSMIGNVIDGQLTTPYAAGQGAILSLAVLAVLIVPMIYYVVQTNRASQAAS